MQTPVALNLHACAIIIVVHLMYIILHNYDDCTCIYLIDIIQHSDPVEINRLTLQVLEHPTAHTCFQDLAWNVYFLNQVLAVGHDYRYLVTSTLHAGTHNTKCALMQPCIWSETPLEIWNLASDKLGIQAY
jgi:hypothetical protein